MALVEFSFSSLEVISTVHPDLPVFDGRISMVKTESVGAAMISADFAFASLVVNGHLFESLGSFCRLSVKASSAVRRPALLSVPATVKLRQWKVGVTPRTMLLPRGELHVKFLGVSGSEGRTGETVLTAADVASFSFNDQSVWEFAAAVETSFH